MNVLSEDLTSAGFLINPSGGAGSAGTEILYGVHAKTDARIGYDTNNPAGQRKMMCDTFDANGYVSYSEIDGYPNAVTAGYYGDIGVMLVGLDQIQANPITFPRDSADSKYLRDLAVQTYFRDLNQLSNFSNLSGMEMISFINLLKKVSLYGISLHPMRFTPITLWTGPDKGKVVHYPIPRVVKYVSHANPLAHFTYAFLDSVAQQVDSKGNGLLWDEKGGPFLGYSVESVKGYINAIEGLFAGDMISLAAERYLRTNASARELPPDMLKADFYNEVNYLHNIDDLILSPLNVNVNDKNSGAPLRNFSVTIPERIPDPRDVDIGVAGKTGDGYYYPRARLKQIYEHAMTLAGDYLIAKTRNLLATGKADINLLLGYRYPTSYGVALAKVDLPNITARRTTEDTIGKYALLGTIALYAGIYLANK